MILEYVDVQGLLSRVPVNYYNTIYLKNKTKVNNIMDELPTISFVTIMHNWEKFCTLFENTWNTFDYPKEKLEWIIIDTSKKDNSSLIPLNENILHIRISSENYLDKIKFENDGNQLLLNYFKKVGKLPNGFLRDYAIGLTSNDYILHVDYDTIYSPNTIKRKLKFLKDNKLECVYCRCMLGYDIYGKGLYKLENKNDGFESTLFHTRGFWERGGFKWNDISSEAVSFYYGKGLERVMDNFYDTIKLLSIHNLNVYQPIKIELENIDIKIPEIVNKLDISSHPISQTLYDIFIDEINVIGIDSEIINIIKKDNWKCNNNTNESNKMKEKNLIKKIKGLNQTNNLCLINTKYPIWSIFKEINFDIVILETNKNFEQMDSILKKNNYLCFENIYFNHIFLIS